MIRSPARAPQSLLVLCIGLALLFGAHAAFAQAPVVTSVYPPDNAQHVASSVVVVFAFDRPTAKHAAYSLADLDPSSGGGLITTAISWRLASRPGTTLSACCRRRAGGSRSAAVPVASCELGRSA
jgi:hypothetical protein